MTMKSFCYFLLIAFCLSNCQPKTDLNLSQDNVVAALTDFGNKNPESEITLKTELGDITIRLYTETPLHRANFLRLVKANYFDKAYFYRLVDGLLAQGGNNPTFPRLNFELPMELNPNLFHKRGAIAMASSRPTEFSSSTEFYLISGREFSDPSIQEIESLGRKFTPLQAETYKKQGGYPDLDGKYTVFGEVTKGMEIVDKISHGKIYDFDQSLERIKFSFSVKP